MGRSSLVVLAGAAMVLSAAAVFTFGRHGTASAATTVTVAVGDNYFANPNPGSHTTTIQVGDTVHWNWVGINNHSVTDDNCPATCVFDYPGSPTFAVGSGSFDFTFNTAGTYNYHCIVHPGMDGTIVVQAATAATPTNTASAATNTPGTATASATPTGTAAATGTVSPTATAGAATSTPVAVSTAPPSSGGSGGVTGLPSTGGRGSAARASWAWLSLALALGGAALIGGTLTARLVGRRAR